MDQNILGTAALNGDRLHHAATLLRPVARINIDVLTPQAPRTMISVSCAPHLRAAVFAGKILYRFSKCHAITAL